MPSLTPFSRLLIVLLLSVSALSGCGEKTVAAPGGSKLEASHSCIDCHQGAISPGSGVNIVDEWKLSHHNSMNAAGCADCHEPEAGHPASCNRCHAGTPAGTPTTVNHVSTNPDRDGKCDKCHARTNGLFPTAGVKEAHFNNNTSVNYPGSYVSSQYERNCRKCHNPHDTTSARNNLRDWATSGHGTVSGFSKFRTKTRDDFDFKTAGSFTLKASQALSDSNNGQYQVCLRCHTTTGFIQYVSSGFSDLSPFGANDPKTGKPFRMDDYPTGVTGFRSKISSDKSKELTNCNACHDNGNGSAYGYKLRSVPRVTTFYNFSSRAGVAMKGGAIRSFGLTFPDVGASNICVACHSGRMTGLDVKMADIRGLELDKAGRIVNHFRGAAELIFRPTDKNGTIVGAGFEFYSSGSSKLQGYSNVNFTHDIIGTGSTNPLRSPEGTQGLAADSRGYGPCVGCHMNAKGNDGTSHTFLPVNRNASSTYRNGSTPSDPITGVTSKACAACHTDAAGKMEWNDSGIDPASGSSYNLLELQKVQYKAAAKAFARLLSFAVDSRTARVIEDAEGRPGTPSNWYGSNITGVKVQPWLRSSTKSDDSDKPLNGLVFYILGAQFTDPLTGATYPLRSAAYTMGSVYNFYMLYYDPGAFAHNRRYVKRLIFDSMDWLDDGTLNKSVCDPAETFTRADDSRNRQYPRLNTYAGVGIRGENDTFQYAAYLTSEELKQASYYLCGSIVTANNADGTIKSYTSDHRPAP
ncbi:MAG TPA: hypothetical protein HPP94_08320 [Desulfuromonadales bacterium]|nr:hypothetical protein [Desulfuromonadales bacterium]